MHVVVHVAVSLDGATTGFAPDLGRFYGLLGSQVLAEGLVWLRYRVARRQPPEA